MMKLQIIDYQWPEYLIVFNRKYIIVVLNPSKYNAT